MKNARFWIFEFSGPVKITLKPNQSLSYSFGYSTDEGYHCEHTTLTHEGHCVRREYVMEDKDCDGKLDRFGEDVCSLHELQSGNEDYDNPNIIYPYWQGVSSGQRDQHAEMMGY